MSLRERAGKLFEDLRQGPGRQGWDVVGRPSEHIRAELHLAEIDAALDAERSRAPTSRMVSSSIGSWFLLRRQTDGHS